MNKTLPKSFLIASFFVLLFFTSCNPQPTQPPSETLSATQTDAAPTATPSPPPARQLTVCLGQEPESLFLYGDSSLAARTIREAIYDGPFDIREYQLQAVILEKAPAPADGDVLLEPVQVQAGDLIVDIDGNLTNLKEGAFYLPAGCSDPQCALSYTGGQPVQMDQLVVRYRLRAGIQWSDGTPLTASDSLYSYEVAQSLLPETRSAVVRQTLSYQALDENTLEWRGIPGLKEADYSRYFYSPLPRHLWSGLSAQELLTAEISARLPVGWGPYVLEEWTAGEQISLNKNPNYFRAAEGLPAFDRLVFRFTAEASEALSALQAGECDFADETALAGEALVSLLELQEQGQLELVVENGTAWEHADFGITPADPARPSLFQVKEVRQAVAMCIDRQSMAEAGGGQTDSLPNTYLPPQHPLYAGEARQYAYDPQAASALLDAAGWRDLDGDPATPRVAAGVPGVVDGTPFQFTYYVLPGMEQAAAEQLKNSLAGCGIQVEVSSGEEGQIFAPGPDGPVFGRRFDMAQFGWPASLLPPCYLYSSAEIPGPYPEFVKGWGGANAAGYSSPEFDRACRMARFSLSGTPENQEAHRQAQQIFAEDLPAIPLYLRFEYAAMRPELCGVVVDPSAKSALWNLETFDSGEACESR